MNLSHAIMLDQTSERLQSNLRPRERAWLEERRETMKEIQRILLSILFSNGSLRMGSRAFYISNTTDGHIVLPPVNGKKISLGSFESVYQRAFDTLGSGRENCKECGQECLVVMEYSRREGRWKGKPCPCGIYRKRWMIVCMNCMRIDETRAQVETPFDFF